MKFLLIVITIISITIDATASNATSTAHPTTAFSSYPSGEYTDKNYSISITIHECVNEFCIGLIDDVITQETMTIMDQYIEQSAELKSTQIIENTLIIIVSIFIETYIELNMDAIADSIQLTMEQEYGEVDVKIINTHRNIEDNSNTDKTSKKVSVLSLLQKTSVQITISGIVLMIAALCIYFCVLNICLKERKQKKRNNTLKMEKTHNPPNADIIYSVSMSPREIHRVAVEMEPGSICHVSSPARAHRQFGSIVTVQAIGARASDDLCDSSASESESLHEKQNVKAKPNISNIKRRNRSSSDEMYYNDNKPIITTTVTDGPTIINTNAVLHASAVNNATQEASHEETNGKPAIRISADGGKVKMRRIRSSSDQMYYNDNRLQRISEYNTPSDQWD